MWASDVKASVLRLASYLAIEAVGCICCCSSRCPFPDNFDASRKRRELVDGHGALCASHSRCCDSGERCQRAHWRCYVGLIVIRDYNIISCHFRGGGADTCACLYFVNINDDGPVAKNGRIRAGDELVAVNGRDVRGLEKSAVAKIIKESEGASSRS